MNPESHRKSILRIARSRGIHPGLALRCLEASTALHSHLESGDRLLWFTDEGGPAWEALSVKPGKNIGDLKRIFCVFVDPSPCTPAFWLEIANLLRKRDIEFRPVFITSESESASEKEDILRTQTVPPADNTDSVSRGLIGKLIVFLEKLEGRRTPVTENLHDMNLAGKGREQAADDRPEEATSSVGSDILPSGTDNDKPLSPGFFYLQPPVIPDSSVSLSSGKKYISKGSSDSVCFLPESVDIRERFKAAEVLSVAGILPIVDICGREAPQAAAWAATRWEEGTAKSVLHCEGNLNDAAAFLAIPGFPVLSPASEIDLQGALEWVEKTETSAFILNPGDAGLPAAALKAPWEKGKAVVVKVSSKGSAGRILCITPGLLAREVRKAADRLVRDNISVKLLSMRFISTVDLDYLETHMEDEDVVLIADAGSSIGGLRSNVGIELMRRGRNNVVFADSVHEARALAEEAAGILRGMRIQRTVDDVRADRWR